MGYLWVVFTLISAFLFAIKDIISKKALTHNTKPLRIIYEESFLIESDSSLCSE